MNDLVPGGYYDGEIVEGRLEVDQQNDGLVMCFDVALGGDQAVTCRHRTTGEYAHIAQEVADYLGMEWPKGLREIAQQKGKKVRVYVKHKIGRTGATFVNAYISTPRTGGVPATLDEINARLAKLAGETVPGLNDDNVPF